MADEPVTIGALGGYTNNQMNREGIKKLLDKIDGVNEDIADISTELEGKQDKLTAGTGITITDENVISTSEGALKDFVVIQTQAEVKEILCGTESTGVSSEDLIIYVKFAEGGEYHYIPKGTPIDKPLIHIKGTIKTDINGVNFSPHVEGNATLKAFRDSGGSNQLSSFYLNEAMIFNNSDSSNVIITKQIGCNVYVEFTNVNAAANTYVFMAYRRNNE